MKTIFCIALLVMSLGCSPQVRTMTERQIDYKYAGFVVFESIARDEDEIEFKFAFVGGQWGHNSGICLSKVEIEVDGSLAIIRAYASVCSDQEIDLKMNLKKSWANEYKVYFEDPDGSRHFVRSFEFTKANK